MCKSVGCIQGTFSVWSVHKLQPEVRNAVACRSAVIWCVRIVVVKIYDVTCVSSVMSSKFKLPSLAMFPMDTRLIFLSLFLYFSIHVWTSSMTVPIHRERLLCLLSWHWVRPPILPCSDRVHGETSFHDYCWPCYQSISDSHMWDKTFDGIDSMLLIRCINNSQIILLFSGLFWYMYMVTVFKAFNHNVVKSNHRWVGNHKTPPDFLLVYLWTSQ